jgi:hypothetical protein
VVWEVEGQDVDVRERVGERRNPHVVRPVAPPDDQDAGIEPDRVAALDRRRRFQPGVDRHPRRLERVAQGLHFAEARVLSRAQEQCATVGDERGIVGVDRIEAGRRRGLRHHDLGARRLELGAEGLVLGGEHPRVGRRPPVRVPPALGLLRAGSNHQHAPQRGGHALRAVRPGRDVHGGGP